MAINLGPGFSAPEAILALDVLETTSDAVAVLDAEWRYVYANRCALAMARLPREKLIGAILWDLFPDLKNGPADSELRRTMDEGVATRFQVYYAPYDIWLEVNAYPSNAHPSDAHPSDAHPSNTHPAGGGLAMFVRDISDRELAGRKLRESEERYRRLFEATGDGILIVNDQGVYVDVNESYCRILKASRERLIGAHFSDFIPPGRLEEAEHAFAALRSGLPYPVDFPLRAIDGSIVELSWTSSSRYLPDLYFCSCRDITAQKRSAAEMRHLLELLPDMIVRCDRERRILYVNPAIERFMGLPPEHFLGKTCREAGFPPQACEETLQNILAGGCRASVEGHIDSPVLGLRHFAAEAIPETDAFGNVVSVLAIIRDVTAQKRAENERTALLAREHKARKTAELLNSVGPALLSQLDLQKLVQSVTDIATKAVGAEFGSFFHNIVNEKGESYMLYTLSGVPREAFEKFPMPRNTAVFGPTFSGQGVVRSANILEDPRYGKSAPYHGMPKGHLPVRSYLAVPVISRSGEVLGGLLFGHSGLGRFTGQHESIVTGIAAQAAIAMDNARLFEQAQWVQNELKRSNEELRRANKDLETFAYSASHDLQEPLRNVALSTQLLQRSLGDALPAEAERFMDGILKGASRMENLLRDLLAYARATQQSEGPAPSISAAAIAAAVLQNLRTWIEQSRAKVVAEDLPVVAMHEVHLSQLFQNLIGNALKYRGKENPRVDITAQRQHGWWVFSVADNGIGIEPRYATQIFGLFKRLHTREQYPGSGIGLAICQRIVEQYGGRIWLERSAPGEGSVFCFSVPER